MAAKRPTPKRRPKGSGTTRQLPSGRWQAAFPGPDGVTRPAPTTFDTKLDAAAWLDRQARDVARGVWTAPIAAEKADSLRGYADTWLAGRDLKPRTRVEYRRLLDTLVLPDLGHHPVDRVTPAVVREWHRHLAPSTPTRRAHAYGLLRTIYSTAVAEDVVPANPCRVRGAGRAKTAHHPRIATLAELDAMVAATPERLRALVLLAAWCGLRFGELTELRRADLLLDLGVVRVQRGVTKVKGAFVVGDPKSEAGRRTVNIPPHLYPILKAHLEQHVEQHVDGETDALLFPAAHGGHLSASTWQKSWTKARAAAGRDDLHLHDLRHTGATLFAATGATLADIMARIGHSTPAAALIYQHAAADRDRAGADALSLLVTATKVEPAE